MTECFRYVGSWKYAPFNLDSDLRKPAAILSRLDRGLTPAKVQALLSPRGFEAPSFRNTFCLLSRTTLASNLWYSNSNLLWSYSLDHIIPASRGGKDHPDNYFLTPLQINIRFGNSWTAETLNRVAYIGLGAALGAGRLRWHGLKLKPSLLSKLQDSDLTSGGARGPSP